MAVGMMDSGTPSDAPETKLRAAFVIAIDTDGNVYVERDTKAVNLPVEREATLLEIRRYTADVYADLQAQAAAEYVTTRLVGLGQKAASAAAENAPEDASEDAPAAE
jgi:hypothetical protein